MHLYLVAAGPAESDRRAGAVARGAGRVTRLSRVAEPGTEPVLCPLYSVHVYCGAAPGCEVGRETATASNLPGECDASRGQVPVVPNDRVCLL